MDSQPQIRRVDSDTSSLDDRSPHESLRDNEASRMPGSGNSPKSSNPFRKHEGTPDYDPTRYSSPESYHPTSGRKHTPVRAVFHDLTTAHSSITSGSAKSRLRTRSNNNSDAPEEENSIPLQDLELAKKEEGSSVSQNWPLPPLPVVLSATRNERPQDFLTDNDEIYIAQNARLGVPMQPSLTGPSHSVFAGIKNALVSISSPSQPNWPRDRQFSKDFDQNSNHEVHYEDDYSNYHSSAGPVQYPPSTPGGIRNSNFQSASNGYPMSYQPPTLPASSAPLPTNTHAYKFSRLVSGSTEISLPEGSTVGNIVQHYAGSEGLDGDGSEYDQGAGTRHSKSRSNNLFKPQISGNDLLPNSPLYGQLQPSALHVRKQRQVDRSKAGYSQSPRFEFPHNRQSSAPTGSSETRGYNSLSVDKPQRALSTKNGPRTPRLQTDGDPDDNEFFDESTSDAANSTLPSLPRISYRNPFRPNQSRGIPSRATPDHCVYDDDPNQGLDPEARVPLEREVSRALRRASGYSVYSVGSVGSSVLDYGAMLDSQNKENPSTNVRLLKGKEQEEVAGEPHMNGGGHVVDQQAKGFYDEDAIPTNWINSHHNIRVPINHNGSFPDSPPDSPIEEQPRKPAQRHSNDDNNDWETVGESGFGFDYAYENDSGLIGGTVRRTGSSIANTSDEGTASIHFADLDEFGSTERIAQHPGAIQYSGDYRRRDLKKTQMPILMPVFNGHKVNGYLADSMRIRPPPVPAYFRPEPLAEAHKHPFNSTPPDVMPPAQAAKPRGILRSHLPPVNSRAASSSQSNTQKGKTSTFRKPSFLSPSSRIASEWTDSYRQTGPSVSTQRHPFAQDEENRPSSWQNIMAFASGGNVPGFRGDGSRTADAQSFNDNSSLREVSNDVSQMSRSSPTAGKGDITGNGRLVPSSGRQPPGDFYKGLRAVSSQKHIQVPGQHDGAGKSPSRRSTVKAHGTTSLRPLSLLNGRLPSTPLRNVSNHSDMFDSDDFVYRSPLAPPLRSTWQKLYSNTRLFELQQRAKADGVYSSQSTLPSASGGLSRRHLYEPPKLGARSEVDHDPDVKLWKIRFSVIVLVLCSFFPPLLIIYALGKMDGIMIWWSDGEFACFGKAQKKLAGIILCVEVVVMCILLIVFLAVFFSKHRG